VGYGTGKAVEPPNDYNFKLPSVRVCNEAVKLGTALFSAGYSNVHVFVDERPSATLAILPYFAGLRFGILAVIGADSAVEDGPPV